MCTPTCVRPRDLGLAPNALDTLAGLYGHPIVRALAAEFRAVGGELYVVGGPVRDALRGHADFADLDFTTDLRPPQTRRALKRFGKPWAAGERFGTLGVTVRDGDLAQKVEVTTFRTEVYTENSRKPEVGFGDSIVEDLRRRDLTVNAIALNVVDGCLIDPFGGIEHLAAGVLDTPDDPVKTLSEDPLRILRALRFGARLEAAMSPRLSEAIRHTRHRLQIVASERRLDELDKLGATSKLCEGLTLAAQLGVLAEWIPGYAADAVNRIDIALGVDEAVAGLLLAHEDPAPLLREMKLPSARIRDIVMMHSLARDLGRTAVTVTDARRLLRAASNQTLSSAERVLYIHRGAWSPISELLWDVAEHEGPGVRAPLPVRGSDLIPLGLKGRAIGAALAELEQRFCREGSLTQADALDQATQYALTLRSAT